MLAPKDWLLHAREALYDPDPARRFEYDVEPDGDSMQASAWHGQGSRQKSHAGNEQRALSRTEVINRQQTVGKGAPTTAVLGLNAKLCMCLCSWSGALNMTAGSRLSACAHLSHRETQPPRCPTCCRTCASPTKS